MANKCCVKRLDDKTLIRIFEKSAALGNAEIQKSRDNSVKFSSVSQDVDLSFSSGLPWDISVDEIKKYKSLHYTIEQAKITFLIEVSQPGNQNQPKRQETVSFNYSRGENSTLTDAFETVISSRNSGFRGAGEQRILKVIHTELSKILQPVTPEDGGLVPTLSNLSEAFNTTYLRISEELSKAVSAVSQERATQLTEFQEEQRRLREDAAQERDDLLAQARKSIEKERLELDAEREELEKERSKLEISSHKDSRRKQFVKMQDDLQAAMAEPIADSGLRKMRWAVFAALSLAGVAAGYFAYITISNQPTATAAATASILFPAIRSVILTFASVGSFLGAAAWLRYFYVRDLQAHEEMRRFRNDMARASWVMDAALEIRKEHNEDIPEEWLHGVTSGLFAAKQKDTLEEGAQALAALMGLSASASFGSGGFSCELNKKGNKAIARAAKTDE